MMAYAGDGEDCETEPPAETTAEPVTEPDPTEPEPEAEGKSGGMGGILLIVIVLAAGVGAFYYFKILKPKQAIKGGTDISELDELDFDDDCFNTGDTDADDDDDGGDDDGEQEDDTE